MYDVSVRVSCHCVMPLDSETDHSHMIDPSLDALYHIYLVDGASLEQESICQSNFEGR
jgi:hypothetical protein